MFISNVVLPHPDLPIIKPLIHWGSKGWLQHLLRFSFQAKFLLPIYIYHFLPYSKMYCLKRRRVTETENITTATSKNDILMTCRQCITCGETKAQFVKKELLVEVFLILLWTIFLSKCICQGITLLVREQNSITDWIRMERQRNGVCRYIQLTTQLIITIYAIQNMMILKLGMRFVIRQCLMSFERNCEPNFKGENW